MSAVMYLVRVHTKIFVSNFRNSIRKTKIVAKSKFRNKFLHFYFSRKRKKCIFVETLHLVENEEDDGKKDAAHEVAQSGEVGDG